MGFGFLSSVLWLHCSDLCWTCFCPSLPACSQRVTLFLSSGGSALYVPTACGGRRGDWAGLPLTLALFLQADLCVMTRLLGYVDPSDPRFVAAILTITFNPLFWNVVSALARPCLGWTDRRMALPSPCRSLASAESSLLFPLRGQSPVRGCWPGKPLILGIPPHAGGDSPGLPCDVTPHVRPMVSVS